ncbi:hypothetical protein JX265_008261 [Neoarthrinium moseri]|uniref:DUF718 domain protein n=1 Tax=Neoarthrinium moseri TaxID=1658444 RepID=A0A9P9WIK1_9PEZI|nr:uncharacterized protein JN550_004960 [Neoarthrinium moseri]KAI1851934.1 hypothetical protein JX266_002787 [Neoarthrinium moseri]KAI1865214.1 hypothetical protein JX265_008261 [Neoarthrinium moseri]KAI1870814.1 hypothetical protein JN550_004960 [Neoarthrinium moseri]
MSQLWTKPTSPITETGPPSPPRAESPKDSGRQKNPGRRIAQIVKLKPEHVAEYKKCHAKVWPEVLQQIKACNIADYSIFWDDASGILFATFKYVGYDYAGDMERMKENPKVREWWAMTDAYQESLVPGAKSSESGEPSWWKGLEEVFYLP